MTQEHQITFGPFRLETTQEQGVEHAGEGEPYLPFVAALG